jgi:hypothetical protein
MVPQGTGVDSGEMLMLLGFALFGYGIFTALRRGGELLDFLRVNLCVAANEALKGLAPIGGDGYRLAPRRLAHQNGGADGDR